MSTKANIFARIFTPALLVMLMLLLAIACKKKDDTPTPPIPPGPPVPAQSDVFQNKPIKMMSDYEIAQNLDFPGHIIHRLGKGMVGGEDPEIPNPFKKIAKTLWEVYDYKHTEMRFDQIDNGLKQIEGQLTQLQTAITDLGTQLSIDVSEMEQLITQGSMNTYITNIKGVMDSTVHNGFGYFPMEGRKYQAGLITESQMSKDTAYASTFVNNVFNAVTAYDVCNWSEQINNLICPSVGAPQDNALMSYANLIIQKANPKNLTDTASLMKCYQLFESYFLQVVNNQFQCVTVWSNACNCKDTTGYQANLYYTGTFTQNITEEVTAFLTTAEYLALNLSDYRHYVNMSADYPYNQSGLAPDFLYTHILARAQFISNLLYDALGLSYPVMCGTIITPYNYANEYGSVVDSISLQTSNKQLNSTAIKLPSQFPYTYWQLSPAVCYPDNQWNVYRFGKMGAGDSGWPCTPVSIQVIDNGNGYYPWSHYQPIKGNVTPLFYNPQNPNQTSTKYSSQCYIQFGYFGARWNWGYMFITMRDAYYLRPQYLDVQNENSTLGCDPYFSPPGAATTDKNGSVYQQSNSQGFSWLHNNLGGCSFSYTCVNTDHYYIAADVLYCDISTSSNVPPISGKLEMWGMSSSQYTGQNGLMKVFLGTAINSLDNWCQVTVVRSTQDIIKENYGNAGSWENFISSVYIDPGKNYQPSAEVYYQAYNPYAVPVAFTTCNMMQVVYDGTYNIFQ